MAVSRKTLREEKKMEYISKLIDFFNGENEEVLRVKSNEIAFPILDREGNEDFIKITVAIPTGANKGTEPYDAYAMAEEYEMKLAEKKIKAEETKKKKEAKIARDKARREKEKEIHEKE